MTYHFLCLVKGAFLFGRQLGRNLSVGPNLETVVWFFLCLGHHRFSLLSQGAFGWSMHFVMGYRKLAVEDGASFLFCGPFGEIVI